MLQEATQCYSDQAVETSSIDCAFMAWWLPCSAVQRAETKNYYKINSSLLYNFWWKRRMENGI